MKGSGTHGWWVPPPPSHGGGFQKKLPPKTALDIFDLEESSAMLDLTLKSPVPC